MDFGKNLLKKYGWAEGQGLGKNSDGIEKPLRANLKFDSAGLGHDKAADFNNHWWERVYNDAASNIEVENEGAVSVTTKNSDELEISTKEYSVQKLKKLAGKSTYNNFLKSSTLSAAGEENNADRVDIDDVAMPRFQPLTDEELFAACGGRTAHKGARHGLKLSGKLSRIEEQERQLLNRMQTGQSSADDRTVWEEVTKKKKKKRKRKIEEEDDQIITTIAENPENTDELADILDTTEYSVKSKKKRKQQQKLDNEISNHFEFLLNDENQERKEEKKKERKRRNKQHRKRGKSRNDEIATNARINVPDELDDQLTVNSLEVNYSDDNNEAAPSTQQTKSKKVKKREKREMEKLVNTLESSVIIAD